MTTVITVDSNTLLITIR